VRSDFCRTKIASLKPDVVITEKGLSDLAAHFLTKVRVLIIVIIIINIYYVI
jgi:hypothetical protein